MCAEGPEYDHFAVLGSILKQPVKNNHLISKLTVKIFANFELSISATRSLIENLTVRSGLTKVCNPQFSSVMIWIRSLSPATNCLKAN